MEIEELVDQYRSFPEKKRMIVVAILAMLPALLYWYDEGEILSEQLVEAQQQEAGERARLESAKRKTSELPNLLAKVDDIENSLRDAQKILPDRVEINQILSKMGGFENELDVDLVKFVPGNEIQPNPQIEYKELPVDVTLRASFPQVMRFYDRILHMENLTHLRSINFTVVEQETQAGEDPQISVESQSKLILFKGL